MATIEIQVGKATVVVYSASNEAVTKKVDAYNLANQGVYIREVGDSKQILFIPWHRVVAIIFPEELDNPSEESH